MSLRHCSSSIFGFRHADQGQTDPFPKASKRAVSHSGVLPKKLRPGSVRTWRVPSTISPSLPTWQLLGRICDYTRTICRRYSADETKVSIERKRFGNPTKMNTRGCLELRVNVHNFSGSWTCRAVASQATVYCAPDALLPFFLGYWRGVLSFGVQSSETRSLFNATFSKNISVATAAFQIPSNVATR